MTVRNHIKVSLNSRNYIKEYDIASEIFPHLDDQLKTNTGKQPKILKNAEVLNYFKYSPVSYTHLTLPTIYSV